MSPRSNPGGSAVDSTTTSPSTDDVAVAAAHGECLPEYCATRRMVLVGAGVAGIAALAACGSKSSGAAAAPAPSAGAGGAALAQLADIPVGTAISAKDNGKPIILC